MLEKLSDFLKSLGYLNDDLNNFAVDHPVFSSIVITILIALIMFATIWGLT